jgi:hypothetical protein
VRHHLVAGELPRGRLERTLVVGEIEIHGTTGSSGHFFGRNASV